MGNNFQSLQYFLPELILICTILFVIVADLIPSIKQYFNLTHLHQIIIIIKDNDEELLKCDGAFIAIGHKPMTNFLENQIDLDDHGYIVHKKNTMTNVDGIFAAGDVVDARYRQAITAAGMGCMAAIDAEKWLEENSF